jgi:hypothetical protein
VSLPIQGQAVSRNSALGSHAPFTFPLQPPADEDARAQAPELRPERPRRASLPTVVVDAAEFGAYHEQAAGPDQGRDGPNHPDEYIGFAVTSGSNPKRRSRSADAFYDASRSHRMSPIQWRHHRGRSDEIRYWRESVCPTPVYDLPLDGRPVLDELQTPVEEAPTSVRADEEPGSDQRDTFDFGILASSMREQDGVGIEARVMTLEVKLMDLEYAISKIQARPPSPMGPTPQHLRPTLQVNRLSPDATPKPKPAAAKQSPTPSNHHTLESTGSTNESAASTQPTAISAADEDVFVDRRARPTSTATTVRAGEPAARPSSPCPSDGKRPRRHSHRDSITGLTIEHFTTLIGLIRREQAARIRLEDQVAELQRQIHELAPPPPPSSSSRPHSRCRSRGWGEYPDLRTDKEALRPRLGPRSATAAEADDLSTDDGCYETPMEGVAF